MVAEFSIQSFYMDKEINFFESDLVDITKSVSVTDPAPAVSCPRVYYEVPDIVKRIRYSGYLFGDPEVIYRHDNQRVFNYLKSPSVTIGSPTIHALALKRYDERLRKSKMNRLFCAVWQPFPMCEGLFLIQAVHNSPHILSLTDCAHACVTSYIETVLQSLPPWVIKEEYIKHIVTIGDFKTVVYQVPTWYDESYINYRANLYSMWLAQISYCMQLQYIPVTRFGFDPLLPEIYISYDPNRPVMKIDTRKFYTFNPYLTCASEWIDIIQSDDENLYIACVSLLKYKVTLRNFNREFETYTEFLFDTMDLQSSDGRTQTQAKKKLGKRILEKDKLELKQTRRMKDDISERQVKRYDPEERVIKVEQTYKKKPNSKTKIKQKRSRTMTTRQKANECTTESSLTIVDTRIGLSYKHDFQMTDLYWNWNLPHDGYVNHARFVSLVLVEYERMAIPWNKFVVNRNQDGSYGPQSQTMMCVVHSYLALCLGFKLTFFWKDEETHKPIIQIYPLRDKIHPKMYKCCSPEIFQYVYHCAKNYKVLDYYRRQWVSIIGTPTMELRHNRISKQHEYRLVQSRLIMDLQISGKRCPNPLTWFARYFAFQVVQKEFWNAYELTKDSVKKLFIWIKDAVCKAGNFVLDGLTTVGNFIIGVATGTMEWLVNVPTRTREFVVAQISRLAGFILPKKVEEPKKEIDSQPEVLDGQIMSLSIIPIICSFCAQVAVRSAGMQKDYGKMAIDFFKDVGYASRGADIVKEFSKSMVGMVYHFFTGSYLFDADALAAQIEEYANDVLECEKIMESKGKYGVVPTDVVEKMNRIHHALRQISIRMAIKQKTGSRTVADGLQLIVEDLIQKCVILQAQSHSRVPPVWMFLHGPSKQGKTHMAHSMATHILEEFRELCKLHGTDDPYVGVKPFYSMKAWECTKEEKYLEGYEGQFSVFCDEVYSCTVDDVNTFWSITLQAWADCKPVPVEKAFQDKGKAFFTSPLVICTTNRLDHVVKTVDPTAYHRRIDFDLNVESDFVAGGLPHNTASFQLTKDAQVIHGNARHRPHNQFTDKIKPQDPINYPQLIKMAANVLYGRVTDNKRSEIPSLDQIKKDVKPARPVTFGEEACNTTFKGLTGIVYNDKYSNDKHWKIDVRLGGTWLGKPIADSDVNIIHEYYSKAIASDNPKSLAISSNYIGAGSMLSNVASKKQPFPHQFDLYLPELSYSFGACTHTSCRYTLKCCVDNMSRRTKLIRSFKAWEHPSYMCCPLGCLRFFRGCVSAAPELVEMLLNGDMECSYVYDLDPDRGFVHCGGKQAEQRIKDASAGKYPAYPPVTLCEELSLRRKMGLDIAGVIRRYLYEGFCPSMRFPDPPSPVVVKSVTFSLKDDKGKEKDFSASSSSDEMMGQGYDWVEHEGKYYRRSVPNPLDHDRLYLHFPVAAINPYDMVLTPDEFTTRGYLVGEFVTPFREENTSSSSSESEGFGVKLDELFTKVKENLTPQEKRPIGPFFLTNQLEDSHFSVVHGVPVSQVPTKSEIVGSYYLDGALVRASVDKSFYGWLKRGIKRLFSESPKPYISVYDRSASYVVAQEEKRYSWWPNLPCWAPSFLTPMRKNYCCSFDQRIVRTTSERTDPHYFAHGVSICHSENFKDVPTLKRHLTSIIQNKTFYNFPNDAPAAIFADTLVSDPEVLAFLNSHAGKITDTDLAGLFYLLFGVGDPCIQKINMHTMISKMGLIPTLGLFILATMKDPETSETNAENVAIRAISIIKDMKVDLPPEMIKIIYNQAYLLAGNWLILRGFVTANQMRQNAIHNYKALCESALARVLVDAVDKPNEFLQNTADELYRKRRFNFIVGGVTLTAITITTAIVLSSVTNNMATDADMELESEIEKNPQTRTDISSMRVHKLKQHNRLGYATRMMSGQVNETHGQLFERRLVPIENNQYMIYQDSAIESFHFVAHALFVRGQVFAVNRHVWEHLKEEFCLIPLCAQKKFFRVLKRHCIVTYAPQGRDLMYIYSPQVLFQKNLFKYTLTEDQTKKYRGSVSPIILIDKTDNIEKDDDTPEVVYGWEIFGNLTMCSTPTEFNMCGRKDVYRKWYATFRAGNAPGDCMGAVCSQYRGQMHLFGGWMAGSQSSGSGAVVPIWTEDWDEILKGMSADIADLQIDLGEPDPTGLTDTSNMFEPTMQLSTKATNYTVFVKTPFQDKDFTDHIEIPKYPAKLTNTAYEKAVKKRQDASDACLNVHPFVVDTVTQYGKELLDGFFQTEEIPSYLKECDFLDSNQAVYGNADTVEKADFSTSDGPRNKFLGYNKENLSDPEHPHSKGIMATLDKFIAMFMLQIFTYAICIDCLKDELRDLERVLLEKTRIFAIMDFYDNMLQKIALGDFMGRCKRFLGAQDGSCGIAVGRSHWRMLYDKFLKAPHGIVAGDIATNDSIMNVICMRVFAPFLWQFYPKCARPGVYRQWITWALLACLQALRFNKGQGMMMGTGNPSGCQITTLFNTLWNSFMHRVCFMYALKVRGIRYTHDEWKYFIREFYSDDNMTASLKYEWWTLAELAAHAKVLFGVTITDPDKGTVFDGVNVPITKCSYLSRTFYPSPRNQYLIHAPLTLSSLISQIFWVRKPAKGACDREYILSQLQTNLNNISAELIEYPFSEAQEIRNRIVGFIADKHLPLTFVVDTEQTAYERAYNNQ
jgi:hypothetical protein